MHHLAHVVWVTTTKEVVHPREPRPYDPATGEEWRVCSSPSNGFVQARYQPSNGCAPHVRETGAF